MAVKTDSGCPCASDERLVWTRDSAEQAVNTPNDEERLEQMSHPKNQGDGTDDAPRKVEWTCLGLAMERSCSLWWRGVQRPQCSPKHDTFDSSSCCPVWVTRHFHFFPRQTKGKPWKHARAHKQTTAQATIREALQSRWFVTCSRTHQGMDTDGLELGYRRP